MPDIDLRRGATLIRYHLQSANICEADRRDLDALADFLDDAEARASDMAAGAPDLPGCLDYACPSTMAACERHCSSCGGDRETSPPCSRNPITGLGGHTWSTGLPEATNG